jgi:hypothetical protein
VHPPIAPFLTSLVVALSTSANAEVCLTNGAPDEERPPPASEGPPGEGVGGIASEVTPREIAELRREMAELKGELSATRQTTEPVPKPEARDVRPLHQGNFYLGGTFGVNLGTKENVGSILGTLDDSDHGRFNFAGRFGRVLIDDALALGFELKYEYSRQSYALSDSLLGLEDAQVERVSYDLSIGPAIRQFLPLDKQHRFFIYYQAALLLGLAEAIDRRFSPSTSSVVSADGYSISLDVQPGVMVAVSKRFAVEAGLNLLGVRFRHYATTTDYNFRGTEQDFKLSADVNLFSLQFAFLGYF